MPSASGTVSPPVKTQECRGCSATYSVSQMLPSCLACDGRLRYVLRGDGIECRRDGMLSNTM